MDRLNKAENKIVTARGLGNSGNPSKETVKINQGNELSNVKSDTADVFKKPFPVVKLFKLDPTKGRSQLKSNRSIIKTGSNPVNNPYNKNNNLTVEGSTSKELPVTLPERRLISPDIYKEDLKRNDFSNRHSCFAEHSYFKTRKLAPQRRRPNTQKSTCLNLQSGNTFKFENRPELVKKRMEQPTIVVRNSITKHVGINSNVPKITPIQEHLSTKSLIKNTTSNLNQAADAANAQEKSNAVKFLTPQIRLRRLEENNDYHDIVIDDDTPMPPPLPSPESNSSEVAKSSKILGRPNSDLRGKHKLDPCTKEITFEGVSFKVAKMETIVQPKGDSLSKSGDKNTDNVHSKNNEVTSLILKKPFGKDASETQKEGGFPLSKPNLTKNLPQDKNWNLEYTEDDAKNLGLDDLLLKASELNAENFTKALGQKSGGRNGNKSDSSDIVLSFPSAKRASDDKLDDDNTKEGSNKRAKIEFLKKCVLDDTMMKPLEVEPFKVPETPKRIGLKVKTVQNINKEFSDSIGAKMKKLEGRDIAPESSIPVFTINDDVQTCNQTAEVFIPDARDKVPQKQSPFLGGRKIINQQVLNKSPGEMSEEIGPFVMTISPAKDQTSANVTPHVFAKPKPVSDRGSFSQKIKIRPTNTAIIKKPEGSNSCSKVNENRGLVASEPRPIEVVNLDDYSEPTAKKVGLNSHFVLNYGSLAKKDGKNVIHASMGTGPTKKSIPILLSSKKKYIRMQLPNSQKLLISPAEELNNGTKNDSPPQQNRAVNTSFQGAANIQGGNTSREKPGFTPTVDQRVKVKDVGTGTGIGKYVQVIPKIVSAKSLQVGEDGSQRKETDAPENENEPVQQPKEEVMTLIAFANILKDILPDKWVLSLDKKYGLQILKTHLDQYLNPSIMISVVVGRSGKVTVNVRGRQLEKNHDLFSNICDAGNSKAKVSINYILAIINNLRFFNICFGCDDLSLKKYWCEDGFIEYFTEFQQTYRSHICESLVRLGRKRCHPCYRMHESLKKRRRREQLSNKPPSQPNANDTDRVGIISYSISNNYRGNEGKRTPEDYIEESFVRMKQKITDEIESARREENERVPKTQEEVLGSMGLARKDSLDVNLRKSKREKKGTRQGESFITNPVTLEELQFLESHWQEINVLFSTSLLVGAYSRTSMGKLKEKCKTFYTILATWRDIIRDNAIWVGGDFNLAENLVNDGEMVDSDSVKNKFDSMDAPALRAYIINCVKEVNRMKNRLRTKNRYFRVLYNTFLKPNMKRGRQTPEPIGFSVVLGGRNLSREEGVPQRLEGVEVPALVEVESSDKNNGVAVPGTSNGN